MANEVRLSDIVIYQVKENTPIRLEVVSGDGQVGGTAVRWKDQTREIGNEEIQIGDDGENLDGEVLQCITTVRDISETHNRTSVTYKLRGGRRMRSFPFGISVTRHKGFAVYNIRFVLIA